MIAKKVWAESLLRTECPNLRIEEWAGVAPEGGEIYLLRQHPYARRLAEAQISFPTTRYALP